MPQITLHNHYLVCWHIYRIFFNVFLSTRLPKGEYQKTTVSFPHLRDAKWQMVCLIVYILNFFFDVHEITTVSNFMIYVGGLYAITSVMMLVLGCEFLFYLIKCKFYNDESAFQALETFNLYYLLKTQHLEWILNPSKKTIESSTNNRKRCKLSHVPSQNC